MTATAIEPARTLAPLVAPVDLPPAGRTERLSWRAVSGATSASVTAASVVVRGVTAGTGRSLGVVAGGQSRVSELVITSTEPGVGIRAVALPGLRRHDGDRNIAVSASGGLDGDLHLVVTPVVGGTHQAPVIAVPALPRKAALPPQLVGGRLSGSVLMLPDLAVTTFRITIVRGDSPEDFAEQLISCGDVTLYAAPMPVGLHVSGPDGTELLSVAGPLGVTEVDLAAALNRHLTAAVTNPSTAEVDATIVLRSDHLGTATVQLVVEGGSIARAVDGRLTAELIGAPALLVVPPPDPGRAARRATADLTITHHGLALHPLSDPVPTLDAGLSGPSVRDTPVVRRLPAEALRGQRLARVAVSGWPLGPTDLTVTVLGAAATVTGLTPAASRAGPTTVWFDLPGPLLVDRPVEVALTATSGAFSWIADPEPLLQLAVAVAPEGERVSVGETAYALAGPETLVTGTVLPGTTSWPVVTDQFCTVSLANLVLEFAP